MSTKILAKLFFFAGNNLMKMDGKRNHILIVDNGTTFLLPVEDILHVKAVRIYSVFYLRGAQREYISSRNLGKIYEQLGQAMFLRVHKSHIVNLHEIKSCELGRGGKITLSDNTVISVAQRRKAELLRHLRETNKNKMILPE